MGLGIIQAWVVLFGTIATFIEAGHLAGGLASRALSFARIVHAAQVIGFEVLILITAATRT